ncbi:MAG: threonine--tRNA ligase, partial [Sphaerochaetaceae bacterium]|nr:threonine--tRNA ligase [Sphaerochaetaceae bacterium]
PMQVKVLPVSEKTIEYATKVYDALLDENVRAVLDDRSEKIGYKIREAQQEDRVPYMLIIGVKEEEEGTVSVRNRKGETTTMKAEEFVALVKKEIKTRAL